MKLLVLVVLLLFVHKSSCAKILLAVPHCIKSLHGLMESIAVALDEAGHDVSMISEYDLKRKSATLKLYQVYFDNPFKEENIFELRNDVRKANLRIMKSTEVITRAMWKDPKMMKLWHQREEFDLIVTMSYMNMMVLPFFHKNNHSSFIQVSTPGFEPISLSRHGLYLPPFLVPDMSILYDGHMNFFERMRLLYQTIQIVYFKTNSVRQNTKMLEDYFDLDGQVENFYE